MEPELAQPKKFNFFFKDINIFKKKPKIVPPSIVKTERDLLDDEIDLFIVSKNASALKIFIDKNISFNTNQIKKIIFNTKPSCLDSLDNDSRRKLFKFNFTTVNNVIAKTLESADEILIDNLNVFWKYGVSNTHKKSIDNLMFASQAISQYGSDFLSQESIASLYKISVNIHKKLLQPTFNESEYALTLAKEVEMTLVKKMSSLYTQIHRTDISQTAARVKLLDSFDINQVMIDDVTNNIKSFSIENLNTKQQTVFNEIKDLSVYLQDHKTDLNPTEILHFENLYFKKLPQIIQQYINIPEKYRAVLNKQPENPDSLLLDSFIEIRDTLNDIMNNIQEHHLHKMKVSNRYLKNN